LQFLTAAGDSIITYSSTKDKRGKALTIPKEFHENPDASRSDVVANKPGMNVFLWDMRYPDAVAVEGTNVMWSGRGTGAKVAPGMYKVRLMIGNTVVGEQPIEIRKDPRLKTTEADYKAQFDLLMKINDKLSETHKGINQIRQIRGQINGYLKDVKDPAVAEKLKKSSKPMLDELDQIESTLMQPKSKAGQDALAYPIRLNDKLAGVGSVVSSADTKPTKASYTVYDDLAKQADAALNKLKELVQKQVPSFNQVIAEQRIPAINAQ
jgi:septal ring factor EnvC (AmiA/AmiB activator)